MNDRETDFMTVMPADLLEMAQWASVIFPGDLPRQHLADLKAERGVEADQ